MSAQHYVIELLEDLHSGEGLGQADTDAMIARAPDGVPELRWSHIKGVLRSNAEGLVRRGLMDQAVVVDMFGWDSDGQQATPRKGRIVVGTAKTVGPAPTHLRTTTALAPTARVPLTDTRRTKEWLPAGSRLYWTCHVPDDLIPPWRQVMGATRALGALRTRGAGRVAITSRNVCLPDSQVQRSAGLGAAASRLRVIVRALEPLCFPMAGQVGNILETEPFLPGSAVRGALLQLALSGDWGPDARAWAEAEVADCSLYFGNGYPAAANDDWRDETVVPAWSHLRQPKWRARQADLPPWVPGGAQVHEAASGSRLTGTWFVAWNKHRDPELRRSQLVHHPRIRVLDRDGASKQALFGTTSLASGTRWVTDLLFPDEAAAAAFAEKVLAPMLRSGIIRLGRGARPAQIEAADWIDLSPSAQFASGHWSLLLTSDLILRGPHLGYLTDLRSSHVLQRLLGNSLHQELEASGHPDPRRLLGGGGIRMVRGFNASTRMPRPFAYAMAKGSALTFSNLDGRLAKAVGDQLNSQRAHGERQHEGFGRVQWVKDLPAQVAGRGPSQDDASIDAAAVSAAVASAKVEPLARQWAASGSAAPLTRRQTGALLELTRRESDADYPSALRAILAEFGQLTAATSHTRDQLNGILMRGDEPALSRRELELLCRWLLVLRGDA